jgi:serine/threonine-protein kinase HipA
MSQLSGCLERASTYMLTESEARELIDHQVEVIEHRWQEVCDLAQMPDVDRSLFWGRQFLNPYAFYGYSAAPV